MKRNDLSVGVYYHNLLTHFVLRSFQGFTKSLIMTILSEVGDRTFCVAAVSMFFITLIFRVPSSNIHVGIYDLDFCFGL